MVIATTRLTPTSDTQGKVVTFHPLELDEIPSAMDKMGWVTAATMMRRWFANPLYIMTEAEKERLSGFDARKLEPRLFDDQIIKMAWALEYPSVREALQGLLARTVTDRSKTALVDRLKRQGWRAGATLRLGSASYNARALDALCQIQYIAFGKTLDRLDDLL